jgi:hypothetical protein
MVGMSRGLWRSYGIRSIAFDPWLHERRPNRKPPPPWGPQAWVTDDFERWKYVSSHTEDCAVFWDEATTHGGDDDCNAGLVSEIRHRHPVLIMGAHSHSSVLRKMRVNLTDLHLALSDDVDAMLWARTMKDPKLKDAAKEDVLPQYAFMHKRSYQPVKIHRESYAQLLAGILP